MAIDSERKTLNNWMFFAHKLFFLLPNLQKKA